LAKEKLILDLKIGEFLDKDIGDVLFQLLMMKIMRLVKIPEEGFASD
jgi:hypothetical protein